MTFFLFLTVSFTLYVIYTRVYNVFIDELQRFNGELFFGDVVYEYCIVYRYYDNNICIMLIFVFATYSLTVYVTL